jgi:hypothetical protein
MPEAVDNRSTVHSTVSDDATCVRCDRLVKHCSSTDYPQKQFAVMHLPACLPDLTLDLVVILASSCALPCDGLRAPLRSCHVRLYSGFLFLHQRIVNEHQQTKPGNKVANRQLTLVAPSRFSNAASLAQVSCRVILYSYSTMLWYRGARHRPFGCKCAKMHSYRPVAHQSGPAADLRHTAHYCLGSE